MQYQNSKHRNRSQTGKGVRFFVGRWHPPNLPTSDSCAWQQQPIKGGTTPCILSQELGIEWMVIILSTSKSPNRFSTMHLWYLISHSTPFFLEQVIALPWPTSHYEPSLFFRTPPNNLEISGVKRVQRSLKSWISTHRPMTQWFSPQFPPPSKMFAQFLWGSPDQNGTFSPSINTYIYPMDHLIPKIETYLDHNMDCQVKWMLYPWSSQHTIGLQDQTTSPRPQFSSEKTIASRFGCLIGILIIVNYMLYNYNPQFNCVV